MVKKFSHCNWQRYPFESADENSQTCLIFPQSQFSIYLQNFLASLSLSLFLNLHCPCLNSACNLPTPQTTSPNTLRQQPVCRPETSQRLRKKRWEASIVSVSFHKFGLLNDSLKGFPKGNPTLCAHTHTYTEILTHTDTHSGKFLWMSWQ